MGSYPMVINVSPRPPYVGRTIFISGELLRRRFVVGIHPLSYAVAGGIEAQGSFTGRGCFETHGNGHVSSPRVRHVCISWDTVVKLPLANPWLRLSRALLVSLVRPVFPLQTLRSHAKTRFPPRDRSRGSAEPDVRGQRGPNCRQSYRPATHPLLPSVVPPPPPSRQQWYGQADQRVSGVKGGRTPGEWMKGGWIRQTGCSTVSCPFITDIWPTRGPCTPPEIQHVRDRYARDIYRYACSESSLKSAYQVVCVRIGRSWDPGSPGAACVSRTQSTLSSAAFLRIPLVSRGCRLARNARGQSNGPGPSRAQLGSHLQAEPFYSVDYNAKLTWPCTNHCCCRPSLPVALTQNRAKQQVQRYRCTATSWGYTSTLRETTEGLPDPFRNDSLRTPSRASGNNRTMYSTKLELDPSVTQVIELNQVAKLYGVCAQDNKALRFRAAESLGNFGIESRGSLRAGIGQGLRWKQSRVLTSYDKTRRVLRQINGRQIVKRGTSRWGSSPESGLSLKYFLRHFPRLHFPAAVLCPRLPAVELRSRVRQVSPLDTVKTLFETLSSACRPRP
ncbi:hypothetical protein ALC53_07156 [Atta colombica]|uniref:Uncharacterized protein n=1 Tax=Atta colombica TaxID=520822 RepID=A0A195BCT3_9HYME|nr:hypothetical protein ALC53_07156 [Atta colombica]